MKNKAGIVAVGMLMMSTIAFADHVDDKKDLRKARINIQKAMKEMDRAQKANEYDMGGHGNKAKEALAVAEDEIRQAIETVRAQ